MKKAIILRSQICRYQVCLSEPRGSDAGVTMILVAVCMVAIIAMAALSIDVVTLYLARMEAQRSADAAALAGARVISVSGITGDTTTDTTSWQAICGTSGLATQAAQSAASQTVANAVPTTVAVYYSSQGAPSTTTDCSTALTPAFAINPTVIVQVTRSGLPTLFSRMWSRSTNSVSATAVAEAFNPSNSGSIASGGQVIPVAPRCVKPWILANADPDNSSKPFVGLTDGSIQNAGISPPGVIGESLILTNACGMSANCMGLEGTPVSAGQYVPALITPPAAAVPSCASDEFQSAIAGCDENTVYACGYPASAGPSPTQADLTINPRSDTRTAVECVTGLPSGQDTLDTSSYPFQIKAGTSNPTQLPQNQVITTSNSIMTIPLFDNTANLPPGNSQPSVSIVGFLQVFVTGVHHSGNIDVNVLNVAGCGNNASTSLSAPGSSPVPVRLISQ
jgi:Flp pilus assembly protein TadG